VSLIEAVIENIFSDKHIFDWSGFVPEFGITGDVYGGTGGVEKVVFDHDMSAGGNQYAAGFVIGENAIPDLHIGLAVAVKH